MVLQQTLVGLESFGDGDIVPLSLSRYFDLSAITRLDISAPGDAPWPVYLAPLSFPALIDLRCIGLEGDGIDCVQTILQSLGLNLRRLHLFSGDLANGFGQLDLPTFCPFLTELGWNETTCEAVTIRDGWPDGRRLDSLLLSPPVPRSFGSTGKAPARVNMSEWLDIWLDEKESASFWFSQTIVLRPQVACFGQPQPDSSLWSDYSPKRAREFARRLAADGRDIKIEDGLGRTIEPLDYPCVFPSGLD